MAAFEIHGVDETSANLNPARLRGPKQRFLARTGIGIQGNARRHAPVDRGMLRNSLAYEVDEDEVRIGTRLPYGPFMEFGTGRLSDAPRHSAGHNPAPHQLDTWARRHGFESGFQVARRIRERGGLKPRRYLRKALDEQKRRLRADAQRMAEEMAAAMGGS